jgi:hypothetical protein
MPWFAIFLAIVSVALSWNELKRRYACDTLPYRRSAIEIAGGLSPQVFSRYLSVSNQIHVTISYEIHTCMLFIDYSLVITYDDVANFLDRENCSIA